MARRSSTAVRRLVRFVLESEPKLPPARVGVALCESGEIHRLNRDWKGKDSPTNVLSFPGTREPATPRSTLIDLGDVIVCPQWAIREATDAGIEPELRLAHLLIHGTLHLLGYDHVTNRRERQIMERRESNLLDQVQPVAWRHFSRICAVYAGKGD